MKISVFTPTYNRAYILDRAYESLKRQTYTNFEWILIDDGSSDNTKELVEVWKEEGIVDIHYVFQENHGRFSAYNTACEYFTGELIAFLDSDDIYRENCLETIANCWNAIDDKNNVSGILGSMQKEDGTLLGTDFPEGIDRERIYVLYDRYKLVGDRLIVMRTDLACQFRYPIYPNERFGGDSIVFNKVNELYPMVLLRDKLVVRQYLSDSITNNLLKNHLQSKNGMREHYRDCLMHETYNQVNIVKHCIGYISYCKMTGVKKIVSNSPKKIRTFLLYPLGLIYTQYLLMREKRI